MRPALATTVAALLALANVPDARAETPSRLSSRIYGGNSISAFDAASSLSVDGHHAHDEGGTVNFAFNAAYLQGITPHFGLGLFADIGSGNTAWSENRGESRTRAQLALGPVFVGPLPGAPHFEWRLGMPLGYTAAWFKPGKARAVDERFSTAHGLNLALVAGLDILGEHHGGFVDLAYALHLTWLTHTATLESDDSVRSEQQYRYFERGLVLGFGYMYRF